VRAEQLGLIYSLMGALDVREPGMSEHAHEVSDLVTAMARALEFDEARTRCAAMAAFLHDPRQHFSAQEWRLLHQHAALGADIVEASPWLADLAPAIRHHQERWDGTGNPDGLAGEAIPLEALEARLIAVAEAYHAMISEQPYQAARSVADALERRAGTQFDPVLVPVLRAVLQSRHEGRDSSWERARPDLLTQV
jgi:putative two-component system response regulator